MLNIDELIKNSLKEKKNIELKVYRNLKTDIIFFKTQKNAPEYTDSSELKIIQNYIKKMEYAEKQYSEALREDLASECRDELEVLRKLIPEPVSIEKLEIFLESNFGKSINKKDMGNVIKQIKSEFPQCDGKTIADLVKSKLV